MEIHKVSSLCFSFWIFFLSLSQSSDSFFIPQFLRRERLVRGGLSTRGQIGGVEDVSPLRFTNRPGPYNRLRQSPEDLQAQQNFQVPDELCLACGSFPWMPVAGKEPIQQPSAQAQPPQSQPIADQQSTAGASTYIDEYPVHQHLEVTREPGNTVVINALGPEPAEGNRKPYAINFNSPQQNNANAPKNNQPQPQPPTYGRPLEIPYEQPKQPQPQSNNEVPRTPSASSVNTQTVAKPPQQIDTNQKRPEIYASQNQPQFNQPPSSYYQNRYPAPPISPLDPQNIPPITVGTILAAQQHYQVTPAKLIYQEHNQQGPQYGSGPRPAQSQIQMSYKLPIIPSRGPSGTVMINQVPLRAVPNYSPPPSGSAPQFIPISQQPQLQFVEMYPPPPYGQSPRQPKPGHPPVPLDFNKFRVPQQQQVNFGSQPQHQQFNIGPQQEFNGVQQQTQFNQLPVYGSLPQKPLPPVRPFTPPQPSAEPRPPFSQNQNSENTPPPSPTYIPPKVTGQGQLFGSFAEESKEKEEILNLNQIQQEAKVNQNQVHFPSSGPSGPQASGQDESQFQNSNKNTQSSFFAFSDSSANQNEEEQPRPITIPHLLQIHQGYRFVDKPVSTLIPGKIFKEEYAQPQKELIQSESQQPPEIKEQEPHQRQPQFQSPPPSTKVEVQTNEYVVRSPSPSGPEENRGGRYEILPATQYEITHLFNKQQQQGQLSDQQRKDKPFPVPVPVPITEEEVAKSKSPLFVVGPPTPLHEENGFYSSSSFGQSGGGSGNQKSVSYFQSQNQYDPLPPSVISALHHAQRTSFLTHSHHTPNNHQSNNDQKTIFVNSIPVSEPNEPIAFSGPRVIRPIAFDLNSGKEIQISSEGDLNTLKIDGEGDKRIFPVFRLQEESIHRPILAQSNENPGDQTVVNCQNNQHWVVPPPSSNQNPNVEVGQLWNQRGSYYYSQPPIYWTVQDVTTEPATTLPPPTTTIPTPPEPSYGEKLVQSENKSEESRTESPKTYFAKPVLKWSKIIVPKSKSTTTSPTTNQNDGDSSTQPSHNVYGKDHVAQVDSGISDDDASSESKELVSASNRLKTVDEGYPILLESGGNKVEIVGPTTIADCITESTVAETGTTEDGDMTTLITTTKPQISSTTFSPRIHPKTSEEKQYKIRNGGSRFPTGRPTISPFRRTTEDPYAGVSASVLVPVYRPIQGVHKSLRSTTTTNSPTTIEEIYKSHEVKELGAEDEIPVVVTATRFHSPTPPPPNSFSTNEDDEADENQLRELPTARRVQSGSNLQSVQGERSTTARIMFSSQIIQSTPPTETSGPTSTKVVKTVRVRQRLRPASYRGFSKNSEVIRSRVRVMTAKPQVESAIPEGETLGADEEKEVKEALIEIRKI